MTANTNMTLDTATTTFTAKNKYKCNTENQYSNILDRTSKRIKVLHNNDTNSHTPQSHSYSNKVDTNANIHNTTCTTSWRSTGWTPLVYPSNALLLHNTLTKNNNKTSNSMTSNTSINNKKLNPYFPLHKNVLLAAARELLLLDGSLDPLTMEIHLPLSGDPPPFTLGYDSHDDDHDYDGCTPQPDQQEGDHRQHEVTTTSTTTTTTRNSILHSTLPTPSNATNTSNNTNTQEQHPRLLAPIVSSMPMTKKNDVGGMMTPFSHYLSLERTFSTDTTNTNTISNLYYNQQQQDEVEEIEAKEEGASEQMKTTAVPIPKIATIIHSTTQNESFVDNACLSSCTAEDLANVIVQKAFKNKNDNTDTTMQNVPFLYHHHSPREQREQSKIPTSIHVEQNPNPPPRSSFPNTTACNTTADSNNVGIHDTSTATSTTTTDIVDDIHDTVIRKVSDADHSITQSTISGPPTNTTTIKPSPLSLSSLSSLLSYGPHISVLALNLHPHSIDPQHSIQMLISNMNHNFTEESILHTIQQEQHNLPKMFNVSIMVETYLRNVACTMVEQMTDRFHDKPMREFLGYKSSAMKRDYITRLFSNYLFDVSHALYAWDQTELDLLGDAQDKSTSTVGRNLDEHIRDHLFDDRALNKIGGFDHTSLLYHALSIRRLESSKIPWKEFVKTKSGKKLFCHHLSERSKLQVGQTRRRAQRMRKHSYTSSMDIDSPSLNESQIGGMPSTVYGTQTVMNVRPRSCSITSSDESDVKPLIDVQASKTSCVNTANGVSTPTPNMAASQCQHETHFQSISPDTMLITIQRLEGKSWGIVLAKEGSMCVVNRIIADNYQEKKCEVKEGDLILSICNEHNETIRIPSNGTFHKEGRIQQPMSQLALGVNYCHPNDWFKDAVTIFKRSYTLRLEVRRVGSVIYK